MTMLSAILLRIYFLTIGFVSAFALTPTIPLPLLVALLIGLSNFFKIRANRTITGITGINVLFYLLFLVIITSYFSQVVELGYDSKTLRHCISYFVVIFLFYYVILFTLSTIEADPSHIFKFIAFGVLITSLFAIGEFVLKNYFHIGSILDQLTFRETYQPLYFIKGNAFIRARSTAEESGHFAMYLAMFSPFAVYKEAIKKRYMKMAFLGGVSIVALLTTFSASAMFSITVSLLITTCIFLYHAGEKKIIKVFLGLMLFFIFVAILLNVNARLGILDAIIAKLTFTDVTSAQDRLRRWDYALGLISQKPLAGWGPGISSFLSDTGIVNLYLELMTQFGIIGFTLLALILGYMGWTIFSIKGKVRYVYLFSYLAGLIHYAAISNYWFPWLWSLMALITYQQGFGAKENNSV